MASEPKLLADHEAGHAVMQWIVGWEGDLEYLTMQFVPGGATNAATKAEWPTCKVLSQLRSRLLFLCAGSLATAVRWDGVRDFDKDWLEIVQLLQRYLKRTLITEPYTCVIQDKEADTIYRTALEVAREIINYPDVTEAINAVSHRLVS